MTTDTDRLATALSESYRIEREIGAGGMAVVYLAEDLKHRRKVAVKVLRPTLAAVLGADRFLKEIEVTANLQHPHILPLHDSGEADGFLYYVMPYVEGESLRRKLHREKQLSVMESVSIATAVASALDYAHRHDVVHRDIKPENILLQDGQPVVSDFGIALAVSAAGRDRMTETGLSLGTPDYMSPEQATGDRELDGRSDVYSLAAVLYEMLAGEPPFNGPSAQAVLTKIMTEKPQPVTAARDTAPPHVAATLQVALAKLPADRFASAAAFAEALEHPGSVALPVASLPRPARAALALPVGAALLVLAGFAAGFLLRGPADVDVVRMSITLANAPAPEGLVAIGDAFRRGRSAVVSSRGDIVVFVGRRPQNEQQLYLRRLDRFESSAIVGTEGGHYPSLAPDGDAVVFRRGLETVVAPLSGGRPRAVSSRFSGAVHWGVDDMLYGSLSETGQLARIPIGGGDPEILTTPAADEGPHANATLLRGGEHVLFDISHPGGAVSTRRIALLSLGSGVISQLVQGGEPAFVEPDLVVFTASSGALSATRIDVRTGTTVGPVRELGEDVPAGSVDRWVTPTGHLVYRAPSEETVGGSLVVATRNGEETPLLPAVVGARLPAVSPDGGRLAVEIAQSGSLGLRDVWLFHLDGSNAPMRLTFEFDNQHPRWDPTGTTVFFDRSDLSGGEGSQSIFRVRADRSAAPRPVWDDQRRFVLTDVAPNGRDLLLYELTQTGRELRTVRGDDDAARRLLPNAANARAATFSRDGRWMAYVSSETGTAEVYVASFPDTGGKWQISDGGGWEPVWAHNGRELFYRGANDYMALEFDTNPTFVQRAQTPLFPTGRYDANAFLAAYDVLPGDTAFVFVKAGEQPDEVFVVLNGVRGADRAF